MAEIIMLFGRKRKVSFVEFADWWLNTMIATKSIGTQGAYKSAVRSAGKFLGPNATIEQANNRKTLVEWQAELAKQFTARTANYYPMIIRSMLKEAKRQGHLIEIVEIDRVRDQQPKPPLEPFTTNEIETLMSAAYERDPMIGTMIEIAARTGMRFGEAAALQWTSIKWEARRIEISVSIYRGKKTSPKSRRHDEWVPMSELCFDALKKLHFGSRSEYVFPNAKGGCIDYHNFYKRKYLPLLRELGLEHKRCWRMLRHTFATLLIRGGANLKDLQRLMRHSDGRLTLNTYSHFYPDRLNETVQPVDRVGVSKQLPLRLVKGSSGGSK